MGEKENSSGSDTRIHTIEFKKFKTPLTPALTAHLAPPLLLPVGCALRRLRPRDFPVQIKPQSSRKQDSQPPLLGCTLLFLLHPSPLYSHSPSFFLSSYSFRTFFPGISF